METSRVNRTLGQPFAKEPCFSISGLPNELSMSVKGDQVSINLVSRDLTDSNMSQAGLQRSLQLAGCPRLRTREFRRHPGSSASLEGCGGGGQGPLPPWGSWPLARRRGAWPGSTQMPGSWAGLLVERERRTLFGRALAGLRSMLGNPRTTIPNPPETH